MVAILLALPVAAQRGEECREVTNTIDGEAIVQTFCRTGDGPWQVRPGAASVPADSDTLPPDFRGKITYTGTHEGSLITPGPAMRNLSVRELLRSAGGGRTRNYAGAYNIELNFDGRNVSGRYWGTGGVNSRTVSGTRTGSRCRLVDGGDGSIVEAECTRSRYFVEIDQPSGRNRIVAVMEAQATQFVDAVVEEKKQRAAAEAARVAREEQQRQFERDRASLIARAEGGDLNSLEILGESYRTGDDGFPLDFREANSWFERAARRGSVFANAKLSIMYSEGQGVAASNARAFEYRLRCASAQPRDDVDRDLQISCMYLAASDYYHGIGTIRNEEQAVRWMRACAKLQDDGCIKWLNERGVDGQ